MRSAALISTTSYLLKREDAFRASGYQVRVSRGTGQFVRNAESRSSSSRRAAMLHSRSVSPAAIADVVLMLPAFSASVWWGLQ